LKFKDERFRVIFFSVLRDTLVCENIDIGTKIAFGGQVRYKVVTEDGKLIDKSGTMSGGGRPKKGGMASNFKTEFSQEDINKFIDEKFKIMERKKQIQQAKF